MKNSLAFSLGIIFLYFAHPLLSQSLLWEISGNGLPKPSYIFGTIHLACEDYQLEPKVMKAIDKSKQVYLELDMDDPALQPKMQQLSLNKDLKNISDELSEDQKNKINEFLTTNYQANLDQLGILKPFVLMSMIMVKRVDCSTPTSIEDLIQKQAKLSEKNIFGLETLEFQIGLFDNIPTQDQIGWIMDLLEDDYSEEYDEILNAYTDENLNELEKLMAESPGMENYLDLLLYQRNENWITIITETSQDKSTFYAVGAGHLAGAEGVIALLKKEGYKVKPVK